MPSSIKRVNSFQELVSTPFADGVNALCWERTLEGDFSQVVLGCSRQRSDVRRQTSPDAVCSPPGTSRPAFAVAGENTGITVLDEARLRGLGLSGKGKEAVEQMIADLRLLRELGRDPVLNCIDGYPRDEDAGPVATDVFSFHADSAPVEADTWLCTYFGAPSEGLRNDEAQRKVDIPETRMALLKEFGGPDEAAFAEWLNENHYDLHYAPAPSAKPWSFGVGHLWRIAVEWPGSPVPPCVHRAPSTVAGEPRLLLIS